MHEFETDIMNCICCWYDLLGYGKPFIDAKWDLSDNRCIENRVRISRISSKLTSSWTVKPLGTKMLLNDGFASTIDLEPSQESFRDTLLFLEGIINDFNSINDNDAVKGEYPGMRGIITCGQRFSHSSFNTTYDITGNRTIAYHPAEFQMNTAFSKAFIMEEAGKAAGLDGPNLFIDASLFALLQEHAKALGYRSPNLLKKDTYNVVQVFDHSGWFADLMVDPTGIKFYGDESDKDKRKGIDTSLYKYLGHHSRIDELAEISAQQTAIRASKSENEF